MRKDEDDLKEELFYRYYRDDSASIRQKILVCVLTCLFDGLKNACKFLKVLPTR